MLLASVLCELFVINRRYMILDLGSITTIRLGLGIRSVATASPEVRARRSMHMNRRPFILSSVTKTLRSGLVSVAS